MDFQNRAGGKTGTGGQASWSEMNRDRRERLRQLALETIDLAKDPYFMKNHLGSYECKLCLTLHNNEGSYLAHTQVKITIYSNTIIILLILLIYYRILKFKVFFAGEKTSSKFGATCG